MDLQKNMGRIFLQTISVVLQGNGNYKITLTIKSGDYNQKEGRNGDKTIIDNLTGLIWTKDANIAEKK